MKYTILSIDDSRKHYKDAIRAELADDWEEIHVECVNGNNREELDRAVREFGVTIFPKIKVGQAGCTLSTLRALTYDDDPILILNDDAILMKNFTENFISRVSGLPHNFDVFSCFVPRDHTNYFYYGHELVNGRLEQMQGKRDLWGHPMFESNGITSRAYQRYGGVALYFSLSGKDKYLKLPHIEEQADDIMYLANYDRKINVYTSIPSIDDLVWISGTEDTLVHNTEFYHA